MKRFGDGVWIAAAAVTGVAAFALTPALAPVEHPSKSKSATETRVQPDSSTSAQAAPATLAPPAN